MKAKNPNQELFLFEEMKSGKEYAFDFFFNYYYAGLRVYASNIISCSVEDSKNVVQDVFLKFWNDRGKISINTSVKSYLFACVRNKCMDYLRTHKPNLKLDESITGNDFQDNQIDTYVYAELEALFNEALNKLPVRCREIFELSRFERLKNREIANQLSISENTVENQMTKALRILKTELKDYLPLFLLFEGYHFFQ